VYPNTHYIDLTDHDWLPLTRISGTVAAGELKRLEPARFISDLTLHAPIKRNDRNHWSSITGRRCRFAHSFQSCRPGNRCQSGLKAKR
jgi:hypothetical protein